MSEREAERPRPATADPAESAPALAPVEAARSAPEPVPVVPAATTPGPAPVDALAAALRRFTPFTAIGILAILLVGNTPVAPWGALLALAWVWRSRTPWREIGFARPASWPRTIVLGIAFGVAFKLVTKTLVMPLMGADPVNRAYLDLVGNRAALPGMIYTLIVGAGFGEETVYRGFLFERLGKLFGHSVVARIAIVVVTSALFALAHATTQGGFGIEQAAITGLVFGAVVMLGGPLPMVMVAHAAYDLTALAIIFAGLETRFAHAIFR